jgi:cation transport regulator ChaC
MDHRGTSEFPGFVVTLVKEDELLQHQLQQRESGSASDESTDMKGDGMFLPECIGNVYLVPKEEAKELIGM